MPADTVARIEVALARVVPSVAFRRGLAELAVKSGYKSGTAFGQFIEEDSARWKATIQRAKISVP